MTDFEVWSVFWFLCDVCCTIENPLPFGEDVWSMCNTMKTGIHNAWLLTVAEQMLTDTFSCWHCQRVRHSLGGAQNCLGPTGLQRSVCTLGTTCDGKAHCMDLSCICWTCYTDKREQYWSLNMVNCTKPEKGCAIEKLLSPSSKENGSIVISKLENCLGTIIVCLFCISLTMVTLSAYCYCGTLRLWRLF